LGMALGAKIRAEVAVFEAVCRLTP